MEQKVVESDAKLRMYQKLQKLDGKTREVMYLRLTGELSFREIGEILEKNETWARVTFYRGKAENHEGGGKRMKKDIYVQHRAGSFAKLYRTTHQ